MSLCNRLDGERGVRTGKLGFFGGCFGISGGAYSGSGGICSGWGERLRCLIHDAAFMVGPDARVGREPGQARKGAAISESGPVPSVARP